MKRAFTLIELLFVILAIGILASIAIPKFTGALNEAKLAEVKSTVTAVRSGLQVYKNKHILLGQSPYPNDLSGSSGLFEKVLPHPVAQDTQKGWEKVSNTLYKYHLDGNIIAFTYNPTNGSFDCDQNQSTISGICNNF
ncbi:type II secretion system protein [Nitratiruptor sp. YY09-18]|uniref:type II secretion system protein n=1 Tax=Nitratiruptor sp. YY09-18 TaxID=2724901 RepID=UPI00191698DA|nr:type II secretion system protein [Nitratiruptor sp. YY09-18]BCD67465.1 general secretion pathway protein G [Nitratiruptor sp. YY09-18]